MIHEIEIKWTRAALRRLYQIESKHFSDKETAEYRDRLFLKINDHLLRYHDIGALADEPKFEGCSRILVERYKVFYKLTKNRKKCSVRGIKHERMK